MWKIITNEWRYFSRTKLFLGISFGFVFLLILTIVMGNLQSEKQKDSYSYAKDHVREQWESIDAMNPHSAAHYGTYVFKPTTLLSGLDDGVSSVTGNLLRVEGHVQNEMVHSEASQMQAVSRFGKLKSSLLLQYIIPLLLVFLAFNIVSAEKQSGRLKLLVLQGASPFQIVLSKTISVWLYGLFFLSLVLLAYSILNFQQIDAEMLTRMSLFFLAYALFYFIICGLTVALSARWHNATLALTTMFGIWILWSIFLPYFFMSSVEKLYDLPSRNSFNTAMKEDRAKGIDGHNPADERGKALKEQVLKEYGVDSLSLLPINFDGLRMQADEEYGNQVWDKHFGNLRTVMARQKRTYQLSGIVNPFASLQ
ncbi:MAG: ABC transporter permease subunit, partial [Calditrichia bacterium]